MRPNPIRVARLDRALTQEALARHAGITRQVVTMTEQGLYHKVPVSLVWTLCDQAEQPDRAVERLTTDYRAWVAAKRADNRQYFTNITLAFANNNHDAWYALRNQVAGQSFSKFCQRLVYQKSLVREFEIYGRGQPGILRALAECGLSSDNLGRLA